VLSIFSTLLNFVVVPCVRLRRYLCLTVQVTGLDSAAEYGMAKVSENFDLHDEPTEIRSELMLTSVPAEDFATY
jgi:hypothetical protein